MHEYSAKLIRVVDGDTVVCRLSLGFGLYLERSIRLLGVDTPELNTGSQKPQAIEAKQWLEGRAAGQDLIIQTHLAKIDSDLDSFGRILGTLFIEGEPISINEQLIQLGYAVVYNKEDRGQK